MDFLIKFAEDPIGRLAIFYILANLITSPVFFSILSRSVIKLAKGFMFVGLWGLLLPVLFVIGTPLLFLSFFVLSGIFGEYGSFFIGTIFSLPLCLLVTYFLKFLLKKYYSKIVTENVSFNPVLPWVQSLFLSWPLWLVVYALFFGIDLSIGF